MSTEMLQIDDLLIDKFNPYAVPGADTFSPGLPQMLGGGYKGRSTLEWYDPARERASFRAPSDKSIAEGMPSVGDYTVDYVQKPALVLNNQPGWKMEFDGLDPLITSSYGLVTPFGDGFDSVFKKVRKATGLKPLDFIIVMGLFVLLVYLVLSK